MKALQFIDGRLAVNEVARPEAAGESLVRVTLAGICNTDLEIVRGYAGFSGTLGHEFVGVVEESADPELIGRRVVGEINAGCGECDLCRAHDPRHCLNRTVLGIVGRPGAFAGYLRLPTVNLYPIPAGVADRAAVFTEPLAAACEILDQVSIGRAARVAVLGDGKLGQLIARVLSTTGCELILIGKHREKLDLAARAGIRTIRRDELTVTPRERFDIVVEATGSPSGFELALDLTRPRGTLVLKSTFHGGVTIDLSRLVVDEISLIGSRCGRFDQALALLAAGAVDPEPLISAQFPLAQGVEAMAAAASGGVMKVLLGN
jgi:threonine dehydrogenase-like Zn-dependent dehydrogenase